MKQFTKAKEMNIVNTKVKEHCDIQMEVFTPEIFCMGTGMGKEYS